MRRFKGTIALSLLLMGAATSVSAAPLKSGSVTATVGASEREPPGLLMLDLRSGRYQLAPLPARDSSGINFVRVRQGRLAATELQEVRAASAMALSAGVADPACPVVPGSRRLAGSSEGAPVLKLTAKSRTLAAPVERECWTGAARTLHSMLETRFASEVDRGR
jgi:hypothetical protein